jgi:tRNA-Thr(GGU) m(6)t(6)A37 methyltransferase TsaA
MSEDIRAGEVAVTLPEKFDAGIYFIGRIHTPWKTRSECPRNARGSDAVCTIELDPRYAAALDGVATCTHLVVLYFMHEARRDLVVQVSRHSGRRGTFALRSPVRPNPIAMSVVRLIRIDGTTLSVVGLDCLDGTPLIDLKPYFVSVDSVPDAVVGWSKKD